MPDLDPDLDWKELYGEHVWSKHKWVRKLYSPLWMLSKDYQAALFLQMSKEERAKIVKERAKPLMTRGSYYSTLPTVAELVGRDKEISIFLNSIYYHILRHPDALKQSYPPPKVFIVKGEPGSGKSYLVKAAMREAFDRAVEEGFILDLKTLEGAAVNSPFMGIYSGAVSGAFATAQKRPTFLWIDEAQQLVQKGSHLQGDSASKEYQQAESAVLQALDIIMSSPVRTVVVMGSNVVEAIREDIRRRAFLIDLDSPGLNHEAMIEIVNRQLKRMKRDDLEGEKVLHVLEQELRGLGEGRMVPHDIARAFQEVVSESEKPIREKFLYRQKEGTDLHPLIIDYDSFKAVAGKVRAYKEQLLTQAVQEAEQTVPPPERYSNVGGLKGIKEEVIKEVTLSLNPSLAGDKWVQPRGYLFHGPYGTGKTLMAKAIAGENKVPIFVVKAGSLMIGVIGESEKSMRQVFSRARSRAPSIIFMDEIDAIGKARGTQIGGNAGVTESMLNSLLIELDGFNPKGRVVFIGATNRRELLDGALLERLDKQFEFTYPKTTAEKLDVIRAQWQDYRGDSEVTPEQILRLFLTRTFSPRVCGDVIKEAARMSQMESIACREMLRAIEDFDGKKQKMLKTVYGDDFDRILKREGGDEPHLFQIYTRVADSNPITFIHMGKAFAKKADTEEDKELRRYSEMHRSREPLVGKGYGLATDDTGSKGIFITVECLMFPAERKGRGIVKTFGNLGVGAKEFAEMARDFIRQYNPKIMENDFSLHVVSLGEGGEQAAVSGPSAGMIFLFVMMSKFLDLRINHRVCMTGKFDLHGIAGIVGGIQPKKGAGKLDAARENGFEHVIIPEEAMKELEKDWQDYLEANTEAGTTIVGGKTWLDYAKLVFPEIDNIEEFLRRKA